MSYTGSDMVLEDSDFADPSSVPMSTGAYQHPFFPSLTVPVSTVAHTPTCTGVNIHTWTIPTCTVDTGDGLSRHVSYTGQTDTRGKSVSFHNGGSKDFSAFENSIMMNKLQSPEQQQMAVGGTDIWGQNYGISFIDRSHDTSVSEGSNFELLTPLPFNGLRSEPERLPSTPNDLVNPLGSVYTYGNETTSKYYMPHTPVGLTDTLMIRIPGSGTASCSYPISNNPVTCQVSTCTNNRTVNMFGNNSSQSSTIQSHMVVSTSSVIGTTVPSSSSDSNIHTQAQPFDSSVTGSVTPCAVGPRQPFNSTAYIPGPSVTTAIPGMGTRCSLQPGNSMNNQTLPNLSNNMPPDTRTYTQQQARSVGFDNFTTQNSFRMPHVSTTRALDTNMYVHSGYQVPYSMPCVEPFVYPQFEYNNNAPVNHFPGSFVGTRPVTGAIPLQPYPSTINAYPNQPNTFGNMNTGFDLRQVGPGFVPYPVNQESRMERPYMGNLDYRSEPRESVSFPQPMLRNPVLGSTGFQNVPPQQADMNQNVPRTCFRTLEVPSGVNIRTNDPNRNILNETVTQTSQPVLQSERSEMQFQNLQKSTEPERSGKIKMLEPETFDGTSSAEWAEYIIHFEQIAEWNGWSNIQKAKMLSIKLRGEAQKLLGSLTSEQYNDYEILKATLSHRFNPQERESAYRCEFRNRRRMKNESPSDFGFALRRLSLKAFPTLSYSALETHVVDQFIAGLGAVELQKFVQFQHPKTLETAINLAIEYTAFVGNLDKITKPALDTSGEITCNVETHEQSKVASLRPIDSSSNFSKSELEQTVEGVVSKKWEKLENQIEKILESIRLSPDQNRNSRETLRNESDTQNRGRSASRAPGSRSASRRRDLSPAGFKKRDGSPGRFYDQRSSDPKQIICTYCSKVGHVENRCYSKLRDLEREKLAKENLN